MNSREQESNHYREAGGGLMCNQRQDLKMNMRDVKIGRRRKAAGGLGLTFSYGALRRGQLRRRCGQFMRGAGRGANEGRIGGAAVVWGHRKREATAAQR